MDNALLNNTNHHVAFLFPGQGSQSQGMLQQLIDSEAVVAACFDEASDVLGYSLQHLIAENPDGRLHQTECTQPALLTASIALLRLWQQRNGCKAVAVAGHSLGEYSALVAAESIAFTDAVALVAYRGEMMRDAIPAGVGKMAAIIGLDDAAVHTCCQQASQGEEKVWLANDNCPGQLVIAGHAVAVAAAMDLCKEGGAKRALPLEVSVPSHTPLMQSAADAMAARLQQVALRTPSCSLWSNVDAAPVNDVETIRDSLVRQLVSPVRWTDCVRNMHAAGMNQAIEMGPGKVLAGLLRRIDRSISVFSSDSDEAMQKALANTTEDRS